MTTLLDQAEKWPVAPTPSLVLRGQVVAKAAAEVIDVPWERLFGVDRTKKATMARRVAMYVLRKLTGESYAAIGAVFNRDHSTVMHHVRQVETALAVDEWTRGYVDKVLIEVATPALLQTLL